jgi:hydrogenase expression/formation protein HypC
MCLAVPGEIVALPPPSEDDFLRNGRVRFGALVKEASLAMVPEARLGDYVLVHAGLAIAIVDEAEAAETLAYLAALDAEAPEPEPDA